VILPPDRQHLAHHFRIETSAFGLFEHVGNVVADSLPLFVQPFDAFDERLELIGSDAFAVVPDVIHLPTLMNFIRRARICPCRMAAIRAFDWSCPERDAGTRRGGLSSKTDRACSRENARTASSCSARHARKRRAWAR